MKMTDEQKFFAIRDVFVSLHSELKELRLEIRSFNKIDLSNKKIRKTILDSYDVQKRLKAVYSLILILTPDYASQIPQHMLEDMRQGI